jgi:hypothetical protein
LKNLIKNCLFFSKINFQNDQITEQNEFFFQHHEDQFL